MKRLILTLTLTVLSVSLLAEEYKLLFQSSYREGDVGFTYQQKWADELYERSDERIRITVLGVGSVLGPSDTLNAVGKGIIHGDMTAPFFFSGFDPLFAMVGDMGPIWSSPEESLKFMAEVGDDHYNKLLNTYGVELIATTSPGSMAFVSKKPLNSLEDLKGLKARTSVGFMTDLFRELGAEAVTMNWTEVSTSLDSGTIEAASFLTLSVNNFYGLYDKSKHTIYPGWHSAQIHSLTINKRFYDKLPNELKNLLQEMGEEYRYGFLKVHQDADTASMDDVKSKGVTIVEWSGKDLDVIYEKSVEIWDAYSDKSDGSSEFYNAVKAWKNR